MRSHRVFFTVFVPAVLAAHVFAGVTITGLSTDIRDGKTTRFDILVDSARLRMNVKGQEADTSMIMLTKGDDYQLLIVNNKKKEYHVLDRQTMEKMQATVNNAMAQLQEQMKKMTPEQKAMMEKVMGKMPGAAAPPAAAPPKTTYRKTGSGTAGGRPCTKYEAFREGEKVAELCAARPEVYHLGPGEVAMFERLTSTFQEMGNMVRQAQMAGPSQMGFASKEIDGVPVEQTGFEDGKPAWRFELKDAEKRSLTDADFSPGDARKVELKLPEAR